MKSNFIKAFALLFALIFLFSSVITVSAEGNEAKQLYNSIVSYKLKETGSAHIQQWINGELSRNAGITSEWYVLALSQNGNYSFEAYEKALLDYLSKTTVYSASSRQKYAVALSAIGGTDPYIYTTLNDSIGKMGIMSWVYGLHLLNNGYTSEAHTASSVKNKLLSLQLADGGWALTGQNGDIDITAMAVQSLAVYYKSEPAVKTAVDKALSLLSSKQQSGGAYKSYGVENPESTAQVLTALSSLGIDCKTDPRFIKDGKTLFDGIKKFELPSGGFCHNIGGGYNENATAQVFYSAVSYLRMKEGKSPLYILELADPKGLKIPEEPEKTDNTASSEVQSAVSDTSKETENSSNIQSSEEQQGVSTSVSDQSVSGEEVKDNSVNADVSQEEKAESEPVNIKNSTVKKQKNGFNYKPWATLCIVIIGGGAALVLYLRKNRNLKNFTVILAVVAILLGFVWLTDFQSADSYYKNAASEKENAVGSVTLEIRCDTVKGENKYAPESGVILQKNEYAIEEGDTVYDILTEATAQNKIPFETAGNATAAYIEGINHIYEFDFGELSGWIYTVNGERPSVSCGEYILTDGDEIGWYYSKSLGDDINLDKK